MGCDLTLFEDQVAAQWKGDIFGGTLGHFSGLPLYVWQGYTLDIPSFLFFSRFGGETLSEKTGGET